MKSLIKLLLFLTIVSIFFAGINETAYAFEYDCSDPPNIMPHTAKYTFKAFSRQKFLYTNNTFGYKLFFTKQWDKLKVFQKTYELLLYENPENPMIPTSNLGNIYNHFFTLPYLQASGKICFQDLFVINIYTHAQWDKIKNEEGPITYPLGENNKYVFILELSQSLVDLSLETLWDEVFTTIKPTFSAFNL